MTAEDDKPEAAESGDSATSGAETATPEVAASEESVPEEAASETSTIETAAVEVAEESGNDATDGVAGESTDEPAGLADLDKAMGVSAAETMFPPAEPELDEQGRSYATGKRKESIARVWIKPGPGRIIVNGKDSEVYFQRPTLRMMINQPFEAAGRAGQYDVFCTVKGGGLSGQAGSVRHGVSKALALHDPDLRPTLKKGGFLTRDSRVVERKKYGKRKARRSFQFSKR